MSDIERLLPQVRPAHVVPLWYAEPSSAIFLARRDNADVVELVDTHA